MSNNLKQAFLDGVKNTLLLFITLITSLAFLFCLDFFHLSCETGFTFKNLVAAVLALASLSNIIPDLWYELVGNLFSKMGNFFINKDEDGLLNKVLESKTAIICITICLMFIIASTTYMLSCNPRLLKELIFKTVQASNCSEKK